MRRASLLHATSEQEYRDIRAFGLRQPVVIVPNGIDLPAPVKRRERPSHLRTLLYLGRIHPIKGIEILLRAWQPLAARHPDWQLRIVGPDSDSHQASLERLARQLGLDRITFAGPRFGADKQTEYAAADLYVLPSFTENFGMTVAEALAQGTPVVTTTGTPWAALREHGCGWMVTPDVDGLVSALDEALSQEPARLAEMGERGRAWMEHEFSWQRVATDFERAYRWLISGGTAPDFLMES
jgi:glycosyltransferase involved in cell wall biosynthesis